MFSNPESHSLGLIHMIEWDKVFCWVLPKNHVSMSTGALMSNVSSSLTSCEFEQEGSVPEPVRGNSLFSMLTTLAMSFLNIHISNAPYEFRVGPMFHATP